ncbi:MAG: type II secretion system protein [Zoogloeaceae bacterium]|nr:type II secretion system protein [Zoogloeaceae bacterium]
MKSCHARQGLNFPVYGRGERGYTYLLVLFLVAGLGLLVAEAGVVWRQAVQREREEQLLAIGREMARALAHYRQTGPQAIYPARLADLVEDKRFPFPVRHLRRIYRDPFTGEAKWGLVQQGGQILGVYSLAPGEPIRTHDLPPELGEQSEAARSYAEWVFRPLEPEAAGGGQGGGISRGRATR